MIGEDRWGIARYQTSRHVRHLSPVIASYQQDFGKTVGRVAVAPPSVSIRQYTSAYVSIKQFGDMIVAVARNGWSSSQINHIQSKLRTSQDMQDMAEAVGHLCLNTIHFTSASTQHMQHMPLRHGRGSRPPLPLPQHMQHMQHMPLTRQ